MKFEIKNRWSGAVQFACKLPAEFEGKSYGDQLGAAIKIAVEADAKLTGADLTGAKLIGAKLTDADLTDADLTFADLTRAKLTRADLTGAKLTCADLTRANLAYANLPDADLTFADLPDANLTGTIGNMREVFSLQLDVWPVTFTRDVIQIGCQRHAIASWWAFSDEEIAQMSGKALPWWKKWKPILKQIVETTLNDKPVEGKGCATKSFSSMVVSGASTLTWDIGLSSRGRTISDAPGLKGAFSLPNIFLAQDTRYEKSPLVSTEEGAKAISE
jgi:hypothetical protein